MVDQIEAMEIIEKKAQELRELLGPAKKTANPSSDDGRVNQYPHSGTSPTDGDSQDSLAAQEAPFRKELGQMYEKNKTTAAKLRETLEAQSLARKDPIGTPQTTASTSFARLEKDNTEIPQIKFGNTSQPGQTTASNSGIPEAEDPTDEEETMERPSKIRKTGAFTFGESSFKDNPAVPITKQLQPLTSWKDHLLNAHCLLFSGKMKDPLAMPTLTTFLKNNGLEDFDYITTKYKAFKGDDQAADARMEMDKAIVLLKASDVAGEKAMVSQLEKIRAWI